MFDRTDANSGGHVYKRCHFTYYVMTDKQFQEMNKAVMEMVRSVLDDREAQEKEAKP